MSNEQRRQLPPTPAELEQLRATAAVVIGLIADLLKAGKKSGDSGVVECPKCKGRLHWSFGPKGSRGLAHRIVCETPDCITAMS